MYREDWGGGTQAGFTGPDTQNVPPFHIERNNFRTQGDTKRCLVVEG